MRTLPFKPVLFLKVLAAILAVVLVAFVIVLRVHGSIALRDVIGSLISAGIGAYLVHLWLLPAEDEEHRG